MEINLKNIKYKSRIFNFLESECIYLAHNPKLHSRSKHIRNRFHFIREQIEAGNLVLKKVAGEKNAADMFTKVLNINLSRN